MPYQREAAIVLEMWREVERDLGAAVPESVEAEALQTEAARLRDEYQHLRLAKDQGRPVPPPLPNAVEPEPV